MNKAKIRPDKGGRNERPQTARPEYPPKGMTKGELSPRTQFFEWLKEICTAGNLDFYARITDDCNPWENTDANLLCRVKVYTHENVYTIDVKNSSRPDWKYYLGCVVGSRKPRAGENHTRGNDLPDGKFCQETWDRIKNAIIAYELVRIAKPERVEQAEEGWRKCHSHYSQPHDYSDIQDKGHHYTPVEHFYAEWEQKGDEIRGHKVYKLVKG